MIISNYSFVLGDKSDWQTEENSFFTPSAERSAPSLRIGEPLSFIFYEVILK